MEACMSRVHPFSLVAGESRRRVFLESVAPIHALSLNWAHFARLVTLPLRGDVQCSS
jgi:hypothetical protein